MKVDRLTNAVSAILIIIDRMSADFPIGQSSLPRSTAEMLAVAEVDRVTSCSFPGTLGLDQEYPRELAAQVLSFLLQV